MLNLKWQRTDIGVTANRLTFKEGVLFAQLVLIHVYIKSKNYNLNFLLFLVAADYNNILSNLKRSQLSYDKRKALPDIGEKIKFGWFI